MDNVKTSVCTAAAILGSLIAADRGIDSTANAQLYVPIPILVHQCTLKVNNQGVPGTITATCFIWQECVLIVRGNTITYGCIDIV